MHDIGYYIKQNIYNKMSSKYSEFRKTKQVQRKPSITVNTNSLNIYQIDQMIQVLASPLRLTSKQSPMKTARQIQLQQKQQNILELKCDSSKNSEMNQTCDLTTNIDSECVAGGQNLEKLLPMTTTVGSCGSSRRYHTQNYGQSKSSGIGNQGGFQLIQCDMLLDETQEQEKQGSLYNKMLASQAQRAQMLRKLKNIETKLKNNSISQQTAEIIIEKLGSLQSLLQKI